MTYLQAFVPVRFSPESLTDPWRHALPGILAAVKVRAW
jgi:hypothetical protein